MITSLHFGHKLASEIPLGNSSSFQEYIRLALVKDSIWCPLMVIRCCLYLQN